MDIVFTSLSYGGMYQFAIQLTKSMINIGIDIVALVPQKKMICDAETFVQTYKQEKSHILQSEYINRLAKQILSLNPKKVFFAENSLTSCLLIERLHGKVEVSIVVHDARPHLSHSFIFYIKEKLKSYIVNKAFKHADYLLFMSENTKKDFLQLHNFDLHKIRVLPLGAHLPNANESIPKELLEIRNFTLFFGRIDKYKGLCNLFAAYSRLGGYGLPILVVAGKGDFTRDELFLIDKLQSRNQIILLNRFISDGEMLWLFHHCNFVCLPYIEASQSGVLPIAYSFGKPVIVSNLPGLTQFVDDGKTGFIYKNDKELDECLMKMNDCCNFLHMEKNVLCFYNEKLNWEENLRKIIK